MLAAGLDYGFVDSDEEVERAAGASVSSIFARHGEAAFRTLEREAIERQIPSEPRVIALGGTFQAPSIPEPLLDSAPVICLDVL